MSQGGPPPTATPSRPDLAPRGRWRRRRFLPTVLVVSVLLVVVLGGFVVAAALEGPAGPPVDVAGVVRIRPVPGWELASRGTIEGSWDTDGGTIADVPYARLTRGSANLDLVVVPGFTGSPTDLARWYASDVLAEQLSQLSFSDVRLAGTSVGGTPAIRFAYLGVHGTAIEGDVVVAVSTRGTGVVLDAWAAQGALAAALDDVGSMIRRVEVDR